VKTEDLKSRAGHRGEAKTELERGREADACLKENTLRDSS